MIQVVRPGDTLSALSRRYGVPVEEIAWCNQIPDPDVLQNEKADQQGINS